ncbi:MAG: hypothetical protein ABIR79_03855 [Candidatus Binatia bacterium]
MNDVLIEETEPIAVEEDPKEALRQSIERSEAELREAVDELTAAVKNDVTLGAYIAERPWTWLLGGFAVGLMLSRR